MPKQYKFNFTVYETELLMLLITKIKSITPIKLGIAFFAIGISLHVVASYTNPFPFVFSFDDPESYKKTFLLNTSWSFAIIFLYPFIVGLTLKYYQEIPKTYEYIFNNLLKGKLADKDFEEIKRHISVRFNNYYILPLTLIITLYLNNMYFLDILNNDYVDWMNTTDGIKIYTDTKTDFTLAGLYAAAIQIVLVYWIMNLVLRGIIFSWSLYYLFNNKNISFQFNTMHPDSCFGLKIIGEVSMILNMILFMLGIYISLKVVDKIFIQGLSLLSDIANPTMLVSFAILAPVLFFFPLGAAHHRMKEAKEDFMYGISEKINQLHGNLSHVNNSQEMFECTRAIKEMFTYLNTMKKNIHIWPFDFKSMEAFFAVIVVPLLPTLFPLILNLFKG